MAYDIDVPAPGASRGSTTTEVERLQLIEDALNDADTRVGTLEADTTAADHIADTTDAHDASAVSVAATPTNYTAGSANVESHLTGIDSALAGLVGGSGAMERIGQVVVGVGGQTTLTFAAIPGTYENLRLVVMGRTARAGEIDNVQVQFNNDTAANYSIQNLFSQDAISTAQELFAQTSAQAGVIAAAGSPANVPGICTIDVPGYARTVFYKMLMGLSGMQRDAAQNQFQTNWAMWSNTAAVTEIDVIAGAGDLFVQGTVATLYGIT